MDKSLTFQDRIVRYYDDNKEYLQYLCEEYEEDYSEFLLHSDEFEKFDSYIKMSEMKAFFSKENRDYVGIGAIRDFIEYGYVNEADFAPQQEPIDLSVQFSELDKLKRDNNGMIPDGVITPDGKYYYAYGGHYLLNSWLMLNGIDTRNAIRVTTAGGLSSLLFSDMNGYCEMDENVLMVTPKQVRAMYNIYKLNGPSPRLRFQTIIEKSHKFGFLDEWNKLLFHKNLNVIEDEIENIHQEQGITPRNIVDGFSAMEFKKTISKGRIIKF